ncbi:MAG TPA: M64 family metallopeptidase, partial [Chitinophagales bacterium]|nr:M64 family metallopeptidase [Chitinophagales bacterium]
MKKFTLVLFAVLCGASVSRAQTFVVDTILNNGDRANRINLVFLGDGYTAGEQTQFISDVNGILDKFFLCSPLTEYKPFFNVYAVRVVSSQSGAKHPNSASDCSTASPAVPSMSPNTYFGATFDYGGTHRLLYCPGTAAINTVLQTNTPWYDKALIVVNTPYYGGSGGNYSIGSVHPSSAEIMIHEFGHSFAGLADEYGGSYCNGLEKPNVTQETNPNLIKWKNWINPGTPIPTPAFTNCGNEGLYNGGNYCTNGWYRPRCDCKMRTLNQPLCAVCKQEFILKIHQSVNLIDAHLPSSASPVNMASNGTQVFSAQVLNNVPNTIKTQWKLNGALVATNVSNYTVNAAALAVGTHTLSITASDTT